MSKHFTISRDGKHFLRGGKPFFWLGDTAWLLFRKLSPEDIQSYLENRARKGFTVIQTTLIHEDDTTNTAGSPALLDENFAVPNPDRAANSFWSQVEQTVQFAGELGLTMALLPAWGSFYAHKKLNLDNAVIYADFLAERFGRYDNVIWLVGGDVRGSEVPEVFNLLGSRLREKCPDQLIGFHPFGRCSSSYWFHEQAWLDFNMFQSGHRNYDQIKLNAWDDKVDVERWVGEDNYKYVRHDLALKPQKPTLDGEPSYELIPQGLHDSSQPYWQASDVRRYAYWAMFSGAAGHTYGDNAIMQFYSGQGQPAYGALHPWQTALHNPGSMQMGHLRKLMEYLKWQEAKPLQDVLKDNTGSRYNYNLALGTQDLVLVYTHSGQTFAVDADKLSFKAPHAYWFDPVVGGMSFLGKMTDGTTMVFAPPQRRSEQSDWVLVLARGPLKHWSF